MKALVVGYGSIGKRHIDNLSKIINIQIIVFTNRPYDNFLKNRRCIILKNVNECIKEKPDFAIISNETSQHVKIANMFAKAGIDFLIEKPLSNNLRGVKELQKKIKRKKLIAYVTCPLRFHPCIKKMKELIEKGHAGRILTVYAENGSYLPSWHKNEDYKKSYAARRDLGGGVILTNIHEIDYLTWFFGEVKEVFSYASKISDLRINVEDSASIFMKFKNNLVTELHLDYFQRPKTRQCKIIGTRGTIYWNLDSNSVKIYNINRKKWVPKLKLKNYNTNSMYLEEIKYFLKCLKKRQVTMNSIDNASEVLKIALALKKSSKTKKMVKL